MRIFSKKAINRAVVGFVGALAVAPLSAADLTWFGETSFSGAYPLTMRCLIPVTG